MEAIFKDIGEWHRLAWESVHKSCLKLSLKIVQYDHEWTEFLIKGQLGIATVDLLAEGQQQDGHENRSSVLDIKYSVPSNLRSKIFEIECHRLIFDEMTHGHSWILDGCTSMLIDSESQSRGV